MDPPYGITENSWETPKWGLQEFQRLYKNILESSSCDEMTFVTFCTVQQYHIVEEALLSSGWNHPRFIVWHKTKKVGEGGRRFLTTNEFMVFAWKKSIFKGVWNYPNPDERSDLWIEPHIGNAFYNNTEGKPINNTQKPQGLLRRIIRHHSNPAGLVLDLCAGSHACLMACLWEGRSCISIEKDKVQHNSAISRFRSEQNAYLKNLEEIKRIEAEDEAMVQEAQVSSDFKKDEEGEAGAIEVEDPDQTIGPDVGDSFFALDDVDD